MPYAKGSSEGALFTPAIRYREGQLWVTLRRPVSAKALPVYLQQRNCLRAASTAGQCHELTSDRPASPILLPVGAATEKGQNRPLINRAAPSSSTALPANARTPISSTRTAMPTGPSGLIWTRVVWFRPVDTQIRAARDQLASGGMISGLV